MTSKRIRQQVGALPYRTIDKGKVELLLITSRDTGRWLIPKGWPMRKKKPHEVARQEAWEEAGVRGRVRKKAWGHYTYMKKLDDGELVPAIVHVHLLDVAQMEDDFPERHQRRLAWFRPSIAASAVEEPELRGLITKSNYLIQTSVFCADRTIEMITFHGDNFTRSMKWTSSY